MHDSNRSHSKSERGVAGLIGVALAVMLLAIGALIVDGGLAMKAYSELDNALDAAVLAGAQELPNTGQATKLAQQFMDLNESPVGLFDSPQITFSFPSDDVIKADGTLGVTTVLAGVLGIFDFTVGSRSAAQRMYPDLVLLFDRSASMCDDSHGVNITCPDDGKKWQPFTKVQNAAKFFVDRMPEGSRISLVSYSTTATLDVGLTSDRDRVRATIAGLTPGGYTDIAGALDSGTTELVDNSFSGRPQIVVLLTDGKPNTINGRYVGYGPPANDPALAAGETIADEGMRLFSIAFGNDADPDFLRQLAEGTEGGEFFPAPTPAALLQAFQNIANLVFVRLVDVG